MLKKLLRVMLILLSAQNQLFATAGHSHLLPGVTQFQINSQVYEILSPLWRDSTDLTWQLGKNAALVLTGQWMLAKLALKAQKYYPPIWQNHDKPGVFNIELFKRAVPWFLFYSITQLISDTALSTLVNWNAASLSSAAEDKLREKYTQDSVLLKLGSLNSSEARAQNLFARFKQATESGLTLQESSIGALTKGIYYLQVLQEHQAVTMAPWMLFFEQAGILSASWAMQKLSACQEKLRPLQTKIEHLQADFALKSTSLVAAGRTKEASEALELWSSQRQSLENDVLFWKKILALIKKHMSTVEFVAKYVYLATWFSPHPDATSIVSAGFEFSKALSWSTDNAEQLQGTLFALGETKKVMDLIEGYITTPHFEVSQSSSPGIEIKDAQILLGDQVLFSITHMKLEPGRHVLIGAMGSGKSTLLKQIAGLREHSVGSTGTLSKSGKIIFVPKDEYWMPYQTLDNSVGAYISHEACKKVNICRNDWHEVRPDWGTVLSSGERKILSLLAAISKQPDILILDEVFTNMDPESIKRAQDLIRALPPNTTVLSVDHEYKAHNQDGFYDRVWTIAEGQLTKSSLKKGCLSSAAIAIDATLIRGVSLKNSSNRAVGRKKQDSSLV